MPEAPKHRMRDEDVRVIETDTLPTNLKDSGVRYRIEVAGPPPFSTLSARVGWWKSHRQASKEAAALRQVLRDWGFMA